MIRFEAPWGQAWDPAAAIATLKKHPGAKLCAVVHGETSTGVENPVAELGAHLKTSDTLLVVDAVTTLGAVELALDAWGVDACYSCSQKGLAVPSGLAPVSFSEKAVAAIGRRRSKVACWYLDAGLLGQYWGGEKRAYHHTAPSNMIYALHEGLRIVEEEGLANRHARHLQAAAKLHRELAGLGFGFYAREDCRLPSLTTAIPPIPPAPRNCASGSSWSTTWRWAAGWGRPPARSGASASWARTPAPATSPSWWTRSRRSSSRRRPENQGGSPGRAPPPSYPRPRGASA